MDEKYIPVLPALLGFIGVLLIWILTNIFLKYKTKTEEKVKISFSLEKEKFISCESKLRLFSKNISLCRKVIEDSITEINITKDDISKKIDDLDNSFQDIEPILTKINYPIENFSCAIFFHNHKNDIRYILNCIKTKKSINFEQLNLKNNFEIDGLIINEGVIKNSTNLFIESLEKKLLK